MPRIADYEHVFTPAAPVSSKTYFRGRQQELSDLLADLRRPGIHPIVIGSRGVGKTTLVNQAIAKNGRIKVGCGKEATFDSLAKAILNGMGYDTSTSEISASIERKLSGGAGFPGIASVSAEGIEVSKRKRHGVADRPLTPWELFELIRDHHDRVVIVIDEYDLVPPSATSFHNCVAELIKHLADHHEDCDSRLVIVGVARSTEALLGQHESIQRNGDEVFVRPLRHKDIRDFLTQAEMHLAFAFTPTVKESLVLEANGYPYYVHLVGLLSVEAMLRRDKRARVVSEEDHQAGRHKAFQKAIRSVLGRHRETLRSLTHDELRLLRTLVSYRAGVAPRGALEGHALQTLGFDPEHFSHVLVQLEKERRLLYWSRGNDAIRFIDPLLPLFLRSWWFRAIPALQSVPKLSNDQLALFVDDEDDDKPRSEAE